MRHLYPFLGGLSLVASLACSGVFGPTEQGAAPAVEHDATVVDLTMEQVGHANLTTAAVEEREAADTLDLPGTVHVDPARAWTVAPVVGGNIASLNAFAHSSVKRGEVLARLQSTELGQAEAAWVQARADQRVASAAWERGQALRKDGVVSEARFAELEGEQTRTRAALDQAERALSLAGISGDRRDALEAEGRRLGELALTSPGDGIVVKSDLQLGQPIAAGEPAFEIADLSSLWVTVRVPASRVAQVPVGAAAVVRVAGGPAEGWPGAVGSLGAEVAADQTVEARVVVANPDGFLRPGMYAQVAVSAAPMRALMVPAGGTFAVGNQAYVFQKESDTRYRAVAVTAAAPVGEWTPVSGPGVQAGLLVVVGGLAELKSHWLYEGGE